MSWLARSIANSLRIDDDGDEDDDNNHHHNNTPNPKRTQSEHDLQDHEEEEEEDRADNQGRGVKEDLSEFKDTLTRQLWGVASFLAPPAPPPPPPPRQSSATSHHHTDRLVSDRSPWESSAHSGSDDISDEDASDSVGVFETRNDFAWRFQTGISNPSNNRAVLDISKMPSNFLPEDQIGGAVGITDEVLAFARNIAHHPETWLDFPLSEEEDMDDFDMSDAQHEHALAVERLAPRLAALRIELCPYHMSDGYFWKVYFVLLHSRLNKHDTELLSTAQIVAARSMWMQELQKRTKPEADWFGRSTSYLKESHNSMQEDYDPDSFDYTPSGNMSSRTFPFEHANYTATTEFETEKHPVVSTEIQIIDKSVIEEEPVSKTKDDFVAGPSYKVPVQNYEDDEDDWLKDNSDLDGYTGTAILLGNEEDVSFSDLEDDDDFSVPIKSKIITKGLDTSTRMS